MPVVSDERKKVQEFFRAIAVNTYEVLASGWPAGAVAMSPLGQRHLAGPAVRHLQFLVLPSHSDAAFYREALDELSK